MSGSAAHHRVHLLLLALLFLVTTVPFLAQTPFNWDSGQLVMGVEHFSVYMHQPHPPGYPLFIGLGKLLAPLLGAHGALQLISAMVAAAALVLLYSLTWLLWPSRSLAFLVSAAFLLNPVFWLFRETALTYTMDAFAGLAIALLTCLQLRRRDRGTLYASALVLGLAGGFRPSLVFLLLPLLAWQWLLVRRWRPAAASAGILLAACLAWYVPLVLISGGPARYYEVSSGLFRGAAEATSMLYGAPWEATRRQLWAMVEILTAALNVMLLPLAITVMLWVRSWRRGEIAPWSRLLILAPVWGGASLLVYGFIHFAPVGYMLTLLPLGYLLAAPGLQWMADRPAGRAGPLLPALLLALHASVFLYLKPVCLDADYVPPSRAETWLCRPARRWPEIFQINAATLAENDLRISSLMRVIRELPADRTVVVTSIHLFAPRRRSVVAPPIDENFRKLGAVLPEYLILEVAPERESYLASQHFRSEFIAGGTVRLPSKTRYVVFALEDLPDDQLPAGLELRRVEMASGRACYVGLLDGPFEFFGYQIRRGEN